MAQLAMISNSDSILATLGKCKPRSLSWHSPHHPILLTDAAFEDGIAGIGAVLVDTLGGKPEVYDGQIPADLIRHWQATGQQQVISQAELAVVVATRHMLKERLSGRRVIYFIDNEAAKFSLLRGTSGKESMQQLTAAFHAVDLAFPSIAWVERIPSESNPSDAPSRGRSSECVKALSGVYSGKIGMPEEVLRAIKSSVGPATSNARLTLPFDSLVFVAKPRCLKHWAVDGAIEALHKSNLINPRWKKLSRLLSACAFCLVNQPVSAATCEYIQFMI